MPNIADITVKKADGTTDIIYTAVVPSSGGTSPATWLSAAGSAPAFKPKLKVRSFGDAAGKQRSTEGTYTFPQISTASDGSEKVTEVAKSVWINTIPQNMSNANIDEFVAQSCNLYKSTLYQACVKAGYAPT
jgi:hypothetical protein